MVLSIINKNKERNKKNILLLFFYKVINLIN
jgi:hypothetical protein